MTDNNIKNIICPNCRKTTLINKAEMNYICCNCGYNLLPGVPKVEYKSAVISQYNKTWGSASDWANFATGYDPELADDLILNNNYKNYK